MTEKVYSFKPGLGLVPASQQQQIRDELMIVLNCKDRSYYYKKARGILNIRIDIKESIEAIFLKYSVSPNKIWKINEKRIPLKERGRNSGARSLGRGVQRNCRSAEHK